MTVNFDWDPEKNAWLADHRQISFEEIICLIEEGFLRAILNHPKKTNQKIFVVERDGYAFNVPFVEDAEGTCILKTAYPSRVSTKNYLGVKP